MNSEITSPDIHNATAYALGELTAEERAAFEQQMENDPALAALARETKEFCSLLDGTLRDPVPSLAEENRAALLLAAAGRRRKSVIWIPWLAGAAAACVAGGYYFKDSFFRTNSQEPRYAEAPRSPYNTTNPAPPSTPPAAPVSTIATLPVRQASPELLAAVKDLRYANVHIAAALAAPPAPETVSSKTNASPLLPPPAMVSADTTVSTVISKLKQRESTRAPETAPTATTASTVTGGTLDLTPKTSLPYYAGNPVPDINSPANRVGIPADNLQLPQPPPMVPAKPAAMSGAGMLVSGYGEGRGGGVSRGSGGGFGDGWGPGSGPGKKPASAPAREESMSAGFRTKLRAGTERHDFSLTLTETGDFDQTTPTVPGAESYETRSENPFHPVLKAPLSTFSIDVDTASYSNVRRFLNMGQCPPPAAVRLEELVNYFPYDYAQPVDGKPFAVHVEMTSAPWDETHRIARIALKGKEIAQAERPAANLVFLVDVSGSMQPENKLPLVKQSLKFVVERLTQKDTVSLVTYAGESGVALPATNGADKARIMAAIDGLGAGGSTNGAGGISTAYQQAAQHFNKEGINRVILATDGDFNVGVTSHEALLKLITEKAKTGVFLSVLGYGMGNTKDDTMELLADKGNGNYAYIDALSEARKVLGEQFAGTLVTIAKDVKIQIEFNPSVIRGYRLLGYENRMLAKEDFKDDKKDAGEIGAGHTVTALYELVPVGAPEPQVLVDDLKYQPKPAEPAPPPPPPAAGPFGRETMTVKLRWKAPDADVSQPMDVPVTDNGAKIEVANPETKWAVAVAGFAAMLNGSQFNGLTWEQIRTLAKAGKGADPNGYRGEFLQLIDRAESVRR